MPKINSVDAWDGKDGQVSVQTLLQTLKGIQFSLDNICWRESSSSASRGGGVRPQRRGPGWRLWQRWVVRPDWEGSFPASPVWIWSGSDPPSPLLWMNGRPGCPLTQMLLRRHEWDSCCCLSHHLCQSPGDMKTVCASCPWTVKHTCWIFQVAYLYSLCQLWRGARIFRMSGIFFFSNCPSKHLV